MNTNKHFKTVLPFLFLACIYIIMLNNTFYGWGWTDEAFYLSTVHRMYCGDRLFLDEWHPTQAYAPLLYPFYALYLKINGSADGIYLFFRILTLIFQTATACISYTILSKNHAKSVALAFSSLLIVFVRAGIPGPSYYTLCLMNFTLGVLLIYAVFENKSAKWLMFAAGIFLAFAVLCNPYLAIPYTTFSLLALIIPGTRRYWKLFLLCWVGTLVSAAVYAILFIPFDSFGDFLRSLRYIFNDPEHQTEGGGILAIKRYRKMPRLLTFPYVITYLPMTIALAVIKIRKIAASQKTLLFLFTLSTALLVANFFIERTDSASAVMALFFYTLLAVCTVKITRRYTLKKCCAEFMREILYAIIPGLVLAYFFCLASNTGFGVCAIGIAFASFGLFAIIQDCYGLKRLFLIPLFAVLVFTTFVRIMFPYRDTPLSPHLLFIPQLQKNTVRISSGSAKGLYTTKEHNIQYEAVRSTINSLPCKDGDGLLISQLIPWAYLERKELRCSAPSTWRLHLNDYRLKPYFTDFPRHHFPEFVLVIDETSIRDNNSINKNKDESWLLAQLEQRNYIQKQVPCGILYMKPQYR